MKIRPTPAQLRWQDCEKGMFFHFGMNTFHDREWGEGKDDPQTFAPADVDCEQWVRVAKETGFQYGILTAKHHDGFCLWPTKTTEYSVKNSPFQGDVVRRFVDACEKYHLHAGLYLSPWDRNAPCYEDEKAYDDFYIRQLTELLTDYGEIFEVWFDGAGSQGRTYNWQRIMDTVAKYQPDAMIFNMGRPTIRWVGNEDGLAPDTCWCEAAAARESMYTGDMATWLPDTPAWVPAECDVPIRKAHWFWHPEDEGSLLSHAELMNIYYRSVGRGANLLLNISPDRDGRLPDADVERVTQMSEALRQHFARPAGQTTGRGDILEMEVVPGDIDCAVIQEDIAFGEFIREFALDTYDGDWNEVARGTSVGHKRLVHFAPHWADKVRLRVVKSTDTPLIRHFSVYSSVERSEF